MNRVNAHDDDQNTLVPMLIIGTLFFVFGFITWLNGALIPFLQIVCELTQSQALFIAFSFYIAYVVTAVPMSWILDLTGYRFSMVMGLGVISLGCFLFVPAAYSRTFEVFLVAQFVVGTGLTILQLASNPYVVKIGPLETAAVRISIMGLLNKGAGVIAPVLFTTLVLGDFVDVTAYSISQLSGIEREVQVNILAEGLVKPYVGMAFAVFLLALILNHAGIPDVDLGVGKEEHQSETSIFSHPQLMLGVFALFLYVGVEVIAADTIGLLGVILRQESATSLTSYTMVFMVIGYLVGLILIPRVLNQSQALAGSAILGVCLSFLILYSDNTSHGVSSFLWEWTSIQTVPDTIAWVALLGFANALVWPTIWPLALAELGSHTTRGAALLIMAIAGGAILPIIYGALAEKDGNQFAYWMLVPCYLFILFYALHGQKMRSWSSDKKQFGDVATSSTSPNNNRE